MKELEAVKMISRDSVLQANNNEQYSTADVMNQRSGAEERMYYSGMYYCCCRVLSITDASQS